MKGLRGRRWDPKKDDAESTWSRMNDAWRDLITYRVRTDDIEDEAVTIAELFAVPACEYTTTIAQSVPNGIVTVLTLSTRGFSTGGSVAPQFDPSTSSVITTVSGLYRLTGRVGMVATAVGAGRISAIVQVNGVNIAQTGIPAKVAEAAQGVAVRTMSLASGDRVTLAAFQNTGAAQTTLVTSSDCPMIQVEYVGRAS